MPNACDPFLAPKEKLGNTKWFTFFHFWQTGMVFEIVNPFSWIFNAIFSEKSFLISKPFLTCLLDFRTLDFFPPAESWLVNSNFPRASRMQGLTCVWVFFSIMILCCNGFMRSFYGALCTVRMFLFVREVVKKRNNRIVLSRIEIWKPEGRKWLRGMECCRHGTKR